MAEDCVCTNLFSIYSVLNDIASSLKYGSSGLATVQNNQLNRISAQIIALTSSIGTLNDVVSKLDDVFKCNNVSIACILDSNLRSFPTGESWLNVIHNDLSSLSYRFTYNDKNIAEIWSLKELCVSNETIVESPLSTFVSKAKLEVDE